MSLSQELGPARLTHGRHCRCSSCAREDWTNPQLAPCGMHGEACPAVYAPIDAPLGSIVWPDGTVVDRSALAARIIAKTLADEGWTCDMHEPDLECEDCQGLYESTAEAMMEALAHPEKYLSEKEIAEYERCKRSIYESAVWFR